MGLALSFIPFFDEVYRQGALLGPILGLGDIKFHESTDNIVQYANKNGHVDFAMDQTVRTFLRERYGVNEYLDCDLHDRADIRVDLASRLESDLVGRFGVVINAGTLEHIFDQRVAHENVHLMLRPGGVVVHLAPVTWYEHAYYNYNPRLFRDIARANSYSLVAEAFHGQPGGDYSGCALTFSSDREEMDDARYKNLASQRDLPANLLYMVAYRKPLSSESFAVPYDIADVAPEVERSVLD